MDWLDMVKFFFFFIFLFFLLYELDWIQIRILPRKCYIELMNTLNQYFQRD